jgi:DNA-binding NarL/FixJ family response regulator
MFSAPCIATTSEFRDRAGGARRPSLRLVAPRAVRVLIADDVALHRAGLRALLEAEDDIAVVGEAARPKDASTLSRDLRPDVLVLDLCGTETDALETARCIITDPQLAGVGVLILTRPDPDCEVRPTHRGRCRFLVKDCAPSELMTAVRELASRTPLRPARQRERTHLRLTHPHLGAASWNSAT